MPYTPKRDGLPVVTDWMLSVSERITSNLTVIHGAGNSPRFEVTLGPLDCSACKRAIEQGELVWMRPERTSTRSLYNVPTCNECTKQVLTGDVYQAPRPAAVLTPEGKQKVREAIAACNASMNAKGSSWANAIAPSKTERQRMREDYRRAENRSTCQASVAVTFNACNMRSGSHARTVLEGRHISAVIRKAKPRRH
jgi:hypothetical protein